MTACIKGDPQFERDIKDAFVAKPRIPRIVDGLHYHLPFYREVFDCTKDVARVCMHSLADNFELDGRKVNGTSIEPMGDGWAVTINLEAQE